MVLTMWRMSATSKSRFYPFVLNKERLQNNIFNRWSSTGWPIYAGHDVVSGLNHIIT